MPVRSGVVEGRAGRGGGRLGGGGRGGSSRFGGARLAVESRGVGRQGRWRPRVGEQPGGGSTQRKDGASSEADRRHGAGRKGGSQGQAKG